jgi:hypothetical protein
MNHRCEVCNIDSPFFIWSTSRYFNRMKLLNTFKDVTKHMKVKILNKEYVVCFGCSEKLGLMER